MPEIAETTPTSPSDASQVATAASELAENTGAHRVVIIGSGFGGLFAAKALNTPGVEVTLVSDTTSHLFQPLLYQVATGILSEGEIAPSTREILAHQDNVRVILGKVKSIDLNAREVTSQVVGRTTVLNYDSVILAAGAGQSYFGNDHFAEFAPGMKSVDDALELRGRIYGAFELAELASNSVERKRLLTFVVVGAGPTGVEMAGQIRELATKTINRDFHSIDPTDASVILLDGANQVLPTFGEHLGGKAARSLADLGVQVQLGAMVTGVDATGLDVRDGDGTTRRIECITKVWAAGVQANPLGAQVAEQSGAEVDRAGRVHVNDDLSLPGHPEAFVIGDMINLRGYPGVAQLAIQGGQFAAEQVKREITGRPRQEQFVYKDKGSMATISKWSAVASVGKRQFSGFSAWLLWLIVHLMAMVGFKNRISTLLHWAITFFGNGRSQRVFTRQQVFARNAIAKLHDEGHESVPELPRVEGDREITS